VVVVDDNSQDGAPDMLQEKYGGHTLFRLLRNYKNQGLCRVFNRGYAETQGTYVVFMHGDTYVDPGWLKHLVAAMEADSRIGAAQGKFLSWLETDVILSAGHTIDYLGFPLKGWGWQAKDDGDFNTPRETFDAWNACMIVRRSVLDEVGAFDPEFFYANEDVDLGWRIRLAGYRVVYVPAARVWHRSAIIATSLPLSFTYHMSRNVLVTLFKNYGFLNLLRFFTVTCALSVARGLGEMVLVNPRHGWTVLKSVFWLPLHGGYLMRERRRTQRLRRVKDSEIMKLMQQPELGIYLGRFWQRRRIADTGTDLKQLGHKKQ